MQQPVSDFRESGLDGWEARSFHGETDYSLVPDRAATGVIGDQSCAASNGISATSRSRSRDPGGHGDPEGRAAGSDDDPEDDDSEDRGSVLRACADGAASGLFRELDVDLERTPVLRWSWWIDAPVAVADVRTRAGDDFAARVYVVFSGGLAFWRTTSLVYVWADAGAPDGFWANPFTDNVRMLAVNRGAADSGSRSGARSGWNSVRRNVVDDYRAAFDAEPPSIAAVAIMTDTDQTGARAVARYGELWFEAATAEVTIGDRATAPCASADALR